MRMNPEQIDPDSGLQRSSHVSFYCLPCWLGPAGLGSGLGHVEAPVPLGGPARRNTLWLEDSSLGDEWALHIEQEAWGSTSPPLIPYPSLPFSPLLLFTHTQWDTGAMLVSHTQLFFFPIPHFHAICYPPASRRKKESRRVTAAVVKCQLDDSWLFIIDELLCLSRSTNHDTSLM